MNENARDPGADRAPDTTDAHALPRLADRALELLAPYQSLLLAVSGGPDSVALMLACAHWRARRFHSIAVATVDHGLRADSRDEAAAVSRWAQALDFPHHLLAWEGDKPATRLQERARAARYALLADCAKRIGATAIVTAHHADDQAETILFRLTRGSGVAGLAGMAAVSPCHGVALLRPMLGFAKTELVGICLGEHHPFFDDPSNVSGRFARTRLRALAPLLAEQGLDRAALLRLGARAAQADAALAHCAGEIFEQALIDDPPQMSLDAVALRSAPREVLLRVIARALQRVSPEKSPRLERLENAVARLAYALETPCALRLTLADVVIEASVQRITLRIAPPRNPRR